MLRRLGGASVARSLMTRPAVLAATNTNVHHRFSTNAHFAVDSPDGEVDGHIGEQMIEINHIIDDASKIEVGSLRDQIIKEHEQVESMAKDGMKFFAVDSPDGENDGYVSDEMDEINHIIEDAAIAEAKGTACREEIERRHQVEKEVASERARDTEHDW